MVRWSINLCLLFRVCSEREDETRMVATHAKYAQVAKYGGTTMMFVVDGIHDNGVNCQSLTRRESEI